MPGPRSYRETWLKPLQLQRARSWATSSALALWTPDSHGLGLKSSSSAASSDIFIQTRLNSILGAISLPWVHPGALNAPTRAPSAPCTYQVFVFLHRSTHGWYRGQAFHRVERRKQTVEKKKGCYLPILGFVGNSTQEKVGEWWTGYPRNVNH